MMKKKLKGTCGTSNVFSYQFSLLLNLYKLANILVVEEERLWIILPRNGPFGRVCQKTAILRKIEANQTNEGRSLSSGALVSMLSPEAKQYTCSTN